MPWRELTSHVQAAWHDASQNAQAKLDYILGGTAMTSPVWVPSMTDTTSFFVMLTAIGGFVLICIRIWRAWKREKSSGD